MAKTWYPIIDQSKCTKCGACVKKCGNGVYNKQMYPKPVIVNPIGCIQGCHGCGNLCPTGAITYVGDQSGWTPPMGKKAPPDPCC